MARSFNDILPQLGEWVNVHNVTGADPSKPIRLQNKSLSPVLVAYNTDIPVTDGFVLEPFEDVQMVKGPVYVRGTGYSRAITVAAIEEDPSTVVLTGVSLASIPDLIAGEKYQLVWTLEPEDAQDVALAFTTDTPAVATVDANGLLNTLTEGGVTSTITATQGDKEFTDSSYTYVTEMSVYTSSLSSLTVGQTQQLEYEVSPSWLTPDKYTVVFTSTDETVATVSSTGLITAVGDGGCRIGAEVSYHGVTSSDSSYQSVDAAAA